MSKKDLRIVFMGTPDFAVGSLKLLVEKGFNVVGVITMPDKPAGRGHKIQYSAVKKYALEHNLPLLQPEKLKDDVFLSDLKNLNADVQIVVAFRMLPQVVWDMPQLGTFNLHASLLPQYRGAAPINWAIINGEQKTGVTTFFLTHEIDTGKIILQEEIPIMDKDDAGTIHDKLMNVGAQLVIKTVDLIIENKVEAVAQTDIIKNVDQLKAAPKIFKETCRINWNMPAKKIVDLIRGLSPYPVAWSELHREGEDTTSVKIYSASANIENHSYDPGKICSDNKSFIHVYTSDGYITINLLQLPGKKAMKTDDLLRGYKLSENDFFQ